MARARGSNAVCVAAFETTYGTPPGSGYRKLPFVSSQLGEERNLIESDLLGYGREPLDPIKDVANNDGDLVVPVDVNNFGNWLRLYMGPPVTTAGTPNVHVFTSGAASLPSMALELGLPEVPSFGMNYGVRGNTMKVDLSARRAAERHARPDRQGRDDGHHHSRGHADRRERHPLRAGDWQREEGRDGPGRRRGRQLHPLQQHGEGGDDPAGRPHRRRGPRHGLVHRLGGRSASPTPCCWTSPRPARPATSPSVG